MKIKTDLVGKKIGCLTVLDECKHIKSKSGTKTMWKCRCTCGNEQYYYRDSLLRRKHEYCNQCRPQGIRNTTLYRAYHSMKQRCYNPKNPNYRNYGAKGVRICNEWLADFNAFKDWSILHGFKPAAGLSIDRIDSAGDYCPENCRWIPLGENSGLGNAGAHKNHTKLLYARAKNPEGTTIKINNISAFCRDKQLNRSDVSAALHGRIKNVYHGWIFYSNKTRQ